MRKDAAIEASLKNSPEAEDSGAIVLASNSLCVLPEKHTTSVRGVFVSGYLFPFALLCVLQSIWQFDSSVAPPFTHAVT